MLLLITYDLKTPGRNYTQLFDTIKTANKWWHYLESTWIIKTTQNVNYWETKLLQVIDKNDRLIIIDITSKDYGGWLPQEAWTWISNNNG